MRPWQKRWAKLQPVAQDEPEITDPQTEQIEEQPAPEPEKKPKRTQRPTRAKVQKMIDEENYEGAMEAITQNPGLIPNFDMNEIIQHTGYQDLFHTVPKETIKSLLPAETKEYIVDDIKSNIKALLLTYKNKGEDLLESDIFEIISDASNVIDFNLKEHIKKELHSEIYDYPLAKQQKTPEEVKKMRDKKLTDSSHREFPYKIVKWDHNPGSSRSEGDNEVEDYEPTKGGKYGYSFAINSTDDIFPDEIFKTLNLHHMPGDKPVAFVSGTYTPGEALWVDEMQSDVVQRAQLYMQSQEDAKAKYQERVDKAMDEYGSEEGMPKDVRDRYDKDKEVLAEISGWSHTFMPQHRDKRSRFQNIFSGWNIIAINTVLNFAQKHDMPVVYVNSADWLAKYWSSLQSGEYTKQLYSRMYDDMVQKRYGAVLEDGWWKIDVPSVMDRIASFRTEMVKVGDYEAMYEKHKPQEASPEVKEKLLQIPEVKSYVEKNIPFEDWRALTLAFWTNMPFYDDTKKAIYLPTTYEYGIQELGEEKVEPEKELEVILPPVKEKQDSLLDDFERDYPTPMENPDDYMDRMEDMVDAMIAEGVPQEEIDAVVMQIEEEYERKFMGYAEPEWQSFDYKYDTYTWGLTDTEIRMILHELRHYADHLERGEEFVEETSGYYKDPDKTQIDMEPYRQTPAEQKSFQAEMLYLQGKGYSDEEIVSILSREYGGEPKFWRGLLPPMKEEELVGA